MKKLIVLAMVLGSLSAQAAEICKTGDLKDCAKKLKALEGTHDFVTSYDQVCKDNKTFACLKRTVRGPVAEEMKYITKEHPGSHFFTTKDGDEDKVFVLGKK